MTDAVNTLIGNELRFAIQASDMSPTEFIDFCAVVDVGAIGEEKTAIDVTTLCSTAREYRGGLADGVEIPLQCNFIVDDELTHRMYQLYRTNEVETFRLYVVGASPEEYFQFDASVRAWNLAVPVGDKATITFTLKISGEVLWVYD